MQVITISPEGVMSGLQRKPGQGLDLRQFGTAKIERVSEIEFDEASQGWFVHVLRGYFAGYRLTTKLWDEFFPRGPGPENWSAILGQDTYLFESYDDAVKAEVAFLDAARIAGRF